MLLRCTAGGAYGGRACCAKVFEGCERSKVRMESVLWLEDDVAGAPSRMWGRARCVLLPLAAYAPAPGSALAPLRALIVSRASGVRACVDDGGRCVRRCGCARRARRVRSRAVGVDVFGSTCKESLTLVVAGRARGGCSQRRGRCGDQSIGSVTPAKRPPQNSRAPDRSVTTRA